jgi:hypothetical protein
MPLSGILPVDGLPDGVDQGHVSGSREILFGG